MLLIPLDPGTPCYRLLQVIPGVLTRDPRNFPDHPLVHEWIQLLILGIQRSLQAVW